jgi:hypothetical protein
LKLISGGTENYNWRYWKPVTDDETATRTFVSFLWKEPLESNLFHMLWKIIQKEFTTLQDCTCYRIIANGTVKGQNITWHTDHGDFTALYFPNDWNPEWGGSTHFLIDGREQAITYKQNRLVLFDANMLHSSSPPTVGNLLRISIAFNIRFNAESPKDYRQSDLP